MTKIQFALDGKQVEASAGETIWQVAKRQGSEIPHLCYSPEPDYRPDGNCRACMVEVEGERVLAASCKRTPSVGMKVKSASPRAVAAQKMVMELLVADQPARATSHDPDSKFWHWAEKVEVTESRFPAAERWHGDASHPAMRVNLDACIQCGLCVRACREVQVNDVIGMAYRGHGSKIVFDFDDPMGESTCVACGECVQACPTGALMPSVMLDENQTRVTYADRKVDSLCPFCGVGCQVTYQVKDEKGVKALAGFGSAKGSNEEAYLFQKLVRTGFGSNNVDHCTRLCHASSVAALMEGINSGAVSNQVRDVMKAEVIFLIGANPTVNHPVAATWMKNAAKAGVKLIVADPRRGDLARHATHNLQFKADTDVALLNAMLHTIVEEGLVNEAFVRDRTSGYEALTDNARCLIALALSTGQIGKPGSGLHPLRGQNNVQGASDSGLIPMFYPDYQRVATPEAKVRFEKLWGMELDPKPGLTVVEIMHAAKKREIRGMYIMGENPAMSDPDVDHAREALASLDHMVVQDIFLTETAYLADVVLPATAWPEKVGTVTNTDRMVQLGRKAIEPPGEAKEDLWLINELARRMGLPWNYSHPREVFDEMRQCMDSIAGITWERLERESSVTYPCEKEGDPGEPVVFVTHFPTTTGRGKFVPADLISAAERPDDQYPMVLITGRQLEHWHTGAMTRRASVLDHIEPEPVASFHPLDLDKLGVKAGEIVTVESRRGRISLYARADDGTPVGAVFIPFCFYEAAANMLTNPVLDPFGKIPEFKYCAVKLTKGGPAPEHSSFGGGTLLAVAQK